MDSFSNIFHSNFKEHLDTPDEFGDYKLQFLNEHQKSFKQLGDFLLTKEDQRGQYQKQVGSLDYINSQVQDLFDLQVQIKLRRYTSFQNGFMEYHRKVLKNTLQNFLTNTSKFTAQNQHSNIEDLPLDDIKSYVFNSKLYTNQQIQQNKNWLLIKVDQYRILRQILSSFTNINKFAVKDAVLMGVWILKHTDHLVTSIKHENYICVKEVQKVKQKLLTYLNENPNITTFKRQFTRQNENVKQYDTMIDSWIYTLLVAKLGYFQNDCFDVNMSLQQHLKALLKQQKREHSVLSDDQDDDIVSLQNLTKKRKF